MSESVTVVVEIFEASACCGGTCGDPQAARTRFKADVAWLEEQGAVVRRNALDRGSDAFDCCEPVRGLVDRHGPACLPIVVVDGAIVAVGAYPDRARLAAFIGAVATPDEGEADAQDRTPDRQTLDGRVATLVALGAAVAADAETALRAHFVSAERLGISREAICAAINIAISTKASAAKSTFDLAQGLLVPESGASGCCGGDERRGEGACCRAVEDGTASPAGGDPGPRSPSGN